MATSIHSGLIHFDDALHGTADDPLGNGIARDGVANGLMHLCDSYAQVRVNYTPIAAAVSNGQSTFETTEVLTSTTEWGLFGGAPFGRWPLTFHSSGRPYPLVIRVGGAMAGGASGQTGKIRVVIAPDYGAAVSYRDRAVHFVFEADIPGPTIAWLTGTTQGATGASSTMMTIPAAVAQTWIRNVAMRDRIGAEPRTVQQALVSAWAFGRTDDTDFRPRLHALSIREYVGL